MKNRCDQNVFVLFFISFILHSTQSVTHVRDERERRKQHVSFCLHRHKRVYYLPPYKSSMATMWSPALSRCVNAVVAPSPDENNRPEEENKFMRITSTLGEKAESPCHMITSRFSALCDGPPLTRGGVPTATTTTTDTNMTP